MKNKIIMRYIGTSVLLWTMMPFLFSCVSTKSIVGETVQYTRKELLDAGLIQEISDDISMKRVIFPSMSQDPTIRKIFTSFLSKVKEINSFDAMEKDAQDDNKQHTMSYMLDLYSYEIAKRSGVYSLAMEVRYGSTGKSDTIDWYTHWYTLNILTKNNRILTYDTLFTNTDDALHAISEYVLEDIKRQKIQRNNELDITDDFFLDISNKILTKIISSFVLLPSQEKWTKFSGIRVYLSQFTMGRAEEGSYAVNVPYSVFKIFLSPITDKLFISEKVPLIIEDPSYIRAKVYPDLRPLDEE